MWYSRLRGILHDSVELVAPCLHDQQEAVSLNIFGCGSTWPKLIKAQFCKMQELKLNLLQRFRWETDVLLLLLWITVPPTAILDRTCPVKFLLI
jgi:hypothetical protein